MIPKLLVVSGAPAFAAPVGTRAVDTAGRVAYMNMTGAAGGWEVLTKSADPSVHNNTWADIFVNSPRQQIGVCCMASNTYDRIVTGLYYSVSGSSAVAAIDADGSHYTTGSSSGTITPSGTPFPHQRRWNPYFEYKFKLGQTTDARYFAGLSDQTAATMAKTDNPAGNYVGIQFSSFRPDTNFQFVMKDGTTQTVVDSSVAVSTNVYVLQVEMDDAVPNIVARLLDGSGTRVATTTFTTNLIGSSTGLRVAAAGAKNTSGRLLRHYWAWGVNRFNKTS